VSVDEWERKLAAVKVRKEDMNRLVMNFLVTEGYVEAAQIFQSESGTQRASLPFPPPSFDLHPPLYLGDNGWSYGRLLWRRNAGRMQLVGMDSVLTTCMHYPHARPRGGWSVLNGRTLCSQWEWTWTASPTAQPSASRCRVGTSRTPSSASTISTRRCAQTLIPVLL
jgi:hypothetical protein